VGEEAVGLEDGRRGAAVGGEEGDVLAADADPAPRGQLEAAYHAEGRRLAAAGWSEEGDELAGSQLEVRLVHRDDVGLRLLVLEDLRDFL